MELNEMTVSTPPNVSTSNESLNMRDLHILEEGPQVTPEGNLSILAEGPQVSQDLTMQNLHILEEGPRVCPLCAQDIKMYFINYHEKIEMCENLECDYPFGYEALKIIREENGVQKVEVKSITAKGSRSTGCSQTSSQGWSDVDKICNAFDSDDTSSVEFNKSKNTPMFRSLESNRRKRELLENVEKIKEMTKSMSDMKNDSKRIIKNEKWIKNLQYLQGLSGFNLLKPAEIKKIKKKALPPGSSEIKIDIDKNNLANIKIEVNRPNASKTNIV